MLKSIARFWLAQKNCLVCRMTHQTNAPICGFCAEKIQVLGPCCWICAQSCAQAEYFCSECKSKASNIHRLYVFYAYQDPLKTVLNAYKFKHAYDVLYYLSALLIEKLPKQALATECLIPAPLHPKKLKQRGFHHTDMLCHALARQLKLPVQRDLLLKIKHTSSQSKLDAFERRHNLEHAFKCQSTNLKHVTLIDDVTTTGATIEAMTSVLQQQGIETIDVWCLAKTN